MSNIDLWGWDKKKRTMIRFIKAGDIFCFKINDSLYGYGQIISIIDIGFIAEILGYSSSPYDVTEHEIEDGERVLYPLFIDAYILFDRKTEEGSDWRIIGRQHNFILKNIENVFFTYGEGSGCKKINVFGEVVAITPEEASTLPFISPKRDFQIKKILNEK